MTATRYPIYIPSKGRFENCLTAKFLAADGTPFRLVVEPSERDQYAQRFGSERVIALPWNNPPGTPDGLIRARNWIRDHAEAEGHARHWQLDDNIAKVRRFYRGKCIPCDSGAAMSACESFVDRYENVAIAGLNYTTFVVPQARGKIPPYRLNVHVYSFTMVNHAMPYRWRLRLNDDTDLCLQALAGGWCTVLFNAFMADKRRTMTVKGGNTDALYRGDGRLRMARMLEQAWPGVVTTRRRFGRAQHVIRRSWRAFDTPLKRRPDVAPAPDPEFGLTLGAVATVRSPELRALLDDAQGRTK